MKRIGGSGNAYLDPAYDSQYAAGRRRRYFAEAEAETARGAPDVNQSGGDWWDARRGGWRG